MGQHNKYRYWLLFCISFLICWKLHFLPFEQIAKATEPISAPEITHSLSDSGSILGKNNQENPAVIYYNSGQYKEAIKLWQQALTQTLDQKTKATIHTNLGSAYRQIGSLGQAIVEWEAASKIYQSMKDNESNQLLARVLTEKAQAYNALGQSRTALPILQLAVNLAQKNQDLTTVAAAHGALGNANLALGDFEGAIASGEASLEIAQKLKNPNFISTASNNLGNVFHSRYQRYLMQANSAKQDGDDKEEARFLDLAQKDAIAAKVAYEGSLEASESLGGIQQAKALLNLARFLQQEQSPPQDLIAQYRDRATTILANLPDSRAKAYTFINLAASLNGETSQNLKIQNLSKAIATTRNIGDQRAESFALTALGEVKQQSGNLKEAMELTQKAQFAAQQVNAADSLYLALALAGRIYQANGNKEAAVLSYRQAIATLQSIRGDIAVASKDLQFELRDSVEPVYRELMALLLEGTGNQELALNKEQSKAPNPNSQIAEALQISELLQLNELQNFFGDECLQIARQNTNSAEIAKNNANNASNTAIIHSIVLNNRTYMLLTQPNGSRKSYPVELSAAEIEKAINQLRFTLEDISTDEYLAESQKLYNLLIRPMAADLAQVKPSTLLFINDGVLRNIPMAALHDGKQFLVQQYAIASSLGLNLTPSKQQAQEDTKAVIFGLSKEIPPFAPLPNVKAETEGLQKILGGKRFLDDDFTLAKLQEQIDQHGYPIVHLATHGKFGADFNTTFLQLFDQRLSLNEFESVLRRSKKPIELLTLSACQTAAGDSRATLGLAGVALRAGVQTTLATLWFVNDADTVPLIQDFYKQIQQPGINKAEALRQAQLKIIADPNGHPAIWSPFVLVGNWQ